MQPVINLVFSLPLSQAEQVLAFVKSLGSTDDISSPHAELLSFTPSPLLEIRDLLDDLEQVVRFIVKKRRAVLQRRTRHRIGG